MTQIEIETEISLRAEVCVRLAREGVACVAQIVGGDELGALRAESDRVLRSATSRGGARVVAGASPILDAFAESGAPAQLARALCGESTRPVKLTVFDKTPAANWVVPWHQDLTIAVRERREVAGFGPWSSKAGVVHVQPPAEVLEELVAIRVHLDDTPASNGALRVIPGSHREGRLDEAAIARWRSTTPERVCAIPAGGAMAMRPLLLHASSAATEPTRRRVIHIDFASCDLPGGLNWI